LLLILSNAPSRPKRYTLSLHDALPIFKPKVAAEHGAVGCLIYSDPREDGYFGGDVFPNGPWRPREGVQRGSVMDMPLYPGDPLTPGVGATPGAKRLVLKEVPTLTKIPVLPLSYG